jgi:uncharacterized protein with gpF-like domain
MREFDELNYLSEFDFEDYMDEFFELMDIQDEQKEKRKTVAREMRSTLLLLFALCLVTLKNGYTDYAFILTMFYDNIHDLAVRYSRDDEYIREYADKVANDIFSITMLHNDPATEENYYFSDKRASMIAVNEANSIVNYEELAEAYDSGATHKTWHTMKDRKVRKEHSSLEGKTIPLEEKFHVGNSNLMFPRDEVNCDDLADISNCRCSLTFS